MGPRPAGSAASRRLAARIRRALPRGRYEQVPGGLRNVVGHLPGSKPAVVVAAHYDTKAIPGFVGANDGAGGTAAVLELARVLRRTQAPRGRARAALRALRRGGGDRRRRGLLPLRPARLAGLREPPRGRAARRSSCSTSSPTRSCGSRARRGRTSELWARLRAAARRVGAQSAFPAARRREITDDHTPFARDGVPAIDLIDFDFPCWHKRCDDMSAVSERSLDASGETVLELLRTWRYDAESL